MNKTLKWVLIVFGILGTLWLVSYISFIIAVSSAFGTYDKFYSAKELKVSFEENHIEIYHLKHYFNSIVPKNTFVSIEFDSDSEIGRLEIISQSIFKGVVSKENFTDWNLPLESKKVDSVIRPLGWNTKTLVRIKELLDEADCIGVESGEPSTIHFKRAGFGMYSFAVFERSMPDSLKREYDLDCGSIYVNPKLALQWGTGAIGSDCFPEKIKR